MKKFNLLRKSERKSVGTTLALTVGSPSAHRRYSALKHLTFMLLFLLGSLNVWGYTITFSTGSGDGTSASTSTACSTIVSDGASYLSGNLVTATKVYYSGNYGLKLGASSNAGTIKMNLASSVTPTSIVVRVKRYNSSRAVTLSVNGSATQDITTDFSNLTFNITTSTSYIQLESSKYCWIESITVNTGSSDPTPSLDHIAITGTPSKTYEQGQSFDPTGLTVTAYYDDDTDADVTGDVEWSFAPATFTVAGENKSVTATATYEGKEDSKTYNDITVTEHVVTAGTYDITFNNAFFGTTGLTGSLSGTNLKDYSGSKDDITVEYKKGTGSNMYLKDSEIRLYSGNTLVITAPSGYNITSVTGLKSTMTANEGTITDTEWSGESNSVTFSHNGTKGNSSLATISVTYAEVDMSKPATPEFSVAAGIYTEAQSVELSCVTDGATIYYTTDGSTPDNTSTEYTGSAISLSERGTYTIKAIAIKGEDASAVASATYTINLPYIFASVSELFTYLDENNLTTLNDVTVTGYVSEIVTEYSTQYSNISFNISDDGSTTAAQLQSYRGKGTDASSIEVGDKVTISGNYKVYNSTKELDQNNTITNRIAKGAVTSVAVSGTATKKTYFVNETFETAGLVVTATYANGFSEVVTEGITWGDDLTDHKVAESTTVQVTATVGGVISAAYDVAIEVSTKALVSIALSADEFEVYQGLELPKPTVTATYSEGDPEDVTALAEFTGYDKTTLGEQTITVSYSFGTGDPIEETYTVTVKPIYNVELPASVARDLIINSVGSAGSGANEMIIRGIVVNPSNPSSSKQTYYISDDGSNTNTVEIFKGLYIDGANFTASNKLIAGDEVVVKGAVTYYQSSTPEFSEGSILQSLARTPNFEVEAVTGFEVGTALAVADLTITQDGEGEVTLASSDNTDAVTIVDGKLHAVAPGTATITANLAADGIYKAATYEFSVTVIPAQVKYAITFDSNGADGGSAPEAIADKAAGAEVTLPANAWTKTGHTFNGWKVINNTTSEEVEVEAGVFTMPASAVTIQAKWAEISVWATTYTSNVTLSYTGTGESNSKVIINEAEYPAQKVGSGSNDGSVVVTVPSGTHTLHFHAVAWNDKSVTITASGVENMSVSSFPLIADAGFKASGTYTLENDPVDQYFAMTFDAVAEETQITFSKTDGDDKRFLLYGVNQEGGVLPASIAANPAYISFGSVEQNASVAAKTINVTLTNVTSATVTLAGDDAFSINKTSLSESGTITVTPNTATVTVGNYAATITISDVAEEADDVVVNVSMTVTEPVINDDVTGTWNLVTDAAALKAGMKVIIAQHVESDGAIYTMGDQKPNNRDAVASTVAGTTLSPNFRTRVFVLEDAGNGMFALKSEENGKYLYAAASSSNNLKSQDIVNDNAKWTITISGGAASIIATESSNRNVMRYNSNNKLFSCYESGQQAIALYARPFDYEREGLQQGMLGTICLPNGGKIAGASIFEIAYMDYEADGTTPYKIYFDEVEGGIMEAGMPYVILANEGSSHLGVYYTDSENKAAQSKKGLVGYMDESGRTLAENEYFIYNNMFYYVSAADAASGRIHISKNHAFINLSAVPGYNNEPISVPAPGRRVSIGNGAPAVATGLENGELKSDEMKKVMINGELFILRGEKMYDATGRLVK